VSVKNAPEGSLLGSDSAVGIETFTGHDPRSGEPFDASYWIACDADVTRACELAAAAFAPHRPALPRDRGRLLSEIAAALDRDVERLVAVAGAETGLPEDRLRRETARTSGQLRLFAGLVAEDAFSRPVVDRAQGEGVGRRPELVYRRIPIGPVAVFAAGNFPLAFSVAGGDTASALAAGCPVVVKGHPAHPGTSLAVGRIVQRVVAECGLPSGLFSLLLGPANALGARLAADPRIRAIAFTGSRRGGLALSAIAQARREPIPVFAEMSSANPVVLFPGALRTRTTPLAEGFVASFTTHAGQLCTKPGLVFGIGGGAFDAFQRETLGRVAAEVATPMTSSPVLEAYRRRVDELVRHPAVEVLGVGHPGVEHCAADPILLRTTAEALRRDPTLGEEAFGPCSMLVTASDLDEVVDTLESLPGQLTVTLQLDAEDVDAARRVLPLAEQKAGRVLINDWPTGVTVSPAMVHGGPFPATTDARYTSVGSTAVDRFLRPVCYQNVPASLLPG
jgi:alpha-ketoglutaric semialdehyde dehydrogenase